MRKITKADAPPELKRWQRRNPGKQYQDLPAVERRVVRTACLDEQKGLCAFCCCPVTVDDGHNAHICSRGDHPHLSLNWNNLVACCIAADNCGKYQGHNDIPLTPLMPECETEFRFYVSGKIEACTDRAQKTLEILNLDNPALRRKRKNALESLLYSFEFHPVEDIYTWDAELIQTFITECGKEIDGILPPYAPVLVNIMHQFSASSRR